MTTSLPAEWRLDGRVCLVTGATSGIGRHAALLLASIGAELVVVGRDASRVARIERDVRGATKGARVTGMVADLSSQADVRRLAQRVVDEVPRLHVLLNNAAVVTMKRTQTVDGFEQQFAVNHLAPFLLTNLLLTRLTESAPARIVTVASQVERDGVIDFDDLQGKREYDGWKAYRQSKLANMLFTLELARRVEGKGLTAISLHPGVYTTQLLGALYGWSLIVTRLRRRGSPGPEVGAQVLARAAADPALAHRNGAHLHEHTLAEPSRQARDGDLARELWNESAKLTGLPM